MTVALLVPSVGLFVREILMRAEQETWHLLSPRLSSIAIGLVLNLLAIGLYALSKKGFGDSVTDKIHFFLMVLLANVAGVILIFVANVGRAPYLLYHDQAAQLEGLVARVNTPKPTCPNCPACPNPVVVANPSLKPIEEWRNIADSLYGPFSANKGVLVVLTAPQQNMLAKTTIYQLMVEVDRRNPPGMGPVTIEPVPDPGESDADIRLPSHNGILVHCSNTLLASMVTRALQKWFIVQSTAIETPNGIKKYGPKEDELNHWTYVWIEVGNGTVWR